MRPFSIPSSARTSAQRSAHRGFALPELELRSVLRQLLIWQQRQRGRRRLAEMTPEQLRDIGLTEETAAQEIAKPFWQTDRS
ncbi:MAG: DUF1127 domain-containing protein [Pseudomonadota bacterium]